MYKTKSYHQLLLYYYQNILRMDNRGWHLHFDEFPLTLQIILFHNLHPYLHSDKYIYLPVSFLNKFTLHKLAADIHRPIPVSLRYNILLTYGFQCDAVLNQLQKLLQLPYQLTTQDYHTPICYPIITQIYYLNYTWENIRPKVSWFFLRSYVILEQRYEGISNTNKECMIEIGDEPTCL
ncbi:hypothetical protein AGLY_001682 [Aphis glycines]|uniref:Uncharacterized protein n=1 Tax=Aphis glycines TaxID=307491 RepID=A0A6G0U4X4_APHGL|nr:hypothetical protein AGLY_001682 [Aphis glycines]